MAFDQQGNLCTQPSETRPRCHVFKIAPGSSRANRPRPSKLSGGSAIAIDGAGNLYAGGFGTFIAVYSPGATSPWRTIPANFSVYGLTARHNGTLLCCVGLSFVAGVRSRREHANELC